MSEQEVPKSFPALKEGEKTKLFTVAPNCSIGDNYNNRKDGGDEIELSHPQAVFLMNKGLITLHVPEFEADEPVANTEEGGDGTNVVAEGDAALDESSETTASPKKKLSL